MPNDLISLGQYQAAKTISGSDLVSTAPNAACFQAAANRVEYERHMRQLGALLSLTDLSTDAARGIVEDSGFGNLIGLTETTSRRGSRTLFDFSDLAHPSGLTSMTYIAQCQSDSEVANPAEDLRSASMLYDDVWYTLSGSIWSSGSENVGITVNTDGRRVLHSVAGGLIVGGSVSGAPAFAKIVFPGSWTQATITNSPSVTTGPVISIARNGSELLAVTESGGSGNDFLFSTDGGATWTYYPHDINGGDANCVAVSYDITRNLWVTLRDGSARLYTTTAPTLGTWTDQGSFFFGSAPLDLIAYGRLWIIVGSGGTVSYLFHDDVHGAGTGGSLPSTYDLGVSNIDRLIPTASRLALVSSTSNSYLTGVIA